MRTDSPTVQTSDSSDPVSTAARRDDTLSPTGNTYRSHYVMRRRDGRTSWTGPIRSPKQVQKEAAAWIDAGWTAEVVPSTPEVRAAVRAWMKAKRSV